MPTSFVVAEADVATDAEKATDPTRGVVVVNTKPRATNGCLGPPTEGANATLPTEKLLVLILGDPVATSAMARGNPGSVGCHPFNSLLWMVSLVLGRIGSVSFAIGFSPFR